MSANRRSVNTVNMRITAFIKKVLILLVVNLVML